uniref:Uncharacterized protein n=1 Tax=Sinocyclocheilus anshuiensis TaxID=1608454 RepID=A0A671NU10_9TELE
MAQIYLVVFWALLLMIIAGDDDIGSLKECENVPFVPGHNLAGEGFDVVTMERRGSYVINTETWDLGNGTCKLLPAAVVDWRALPKCSMKVSSQIFESSEALVNDSSSALSVSWKVGRCQGRWSCSWKHSFLGSKFCNEKIKSRQIQFHQTGCFSSLILYRVAENPPLHAEFLEAIKSLPASYDKDAYRDLITYGTHYTTSVKLGRQMKAITAIKSCQAAVSGLTDTAVKDCLDVEASGSYNAATVKAKTYFCQEQKRKMRTNEKFRSMFNDRKMEIIGGDKNGEDLLFSDRCACVCESSQIIKSNCRPAEKGLATLKVYSLRAKGLYGDRSTQIDCTVTVTYDNQIKRTETIDDNDNPRWPETFKFGPIKNDSSWNSDFLGTCSFHLRSGVVTDACVFKYGTFYFTYEAKCAPSLQGPQCNEYKPSPMLRRSAFV